MAGDGRRFSVTVTARSSAAPAALFRLVADGGRWSEWAGTLSPRSSWERQGDPAPGGIGAIRRLGLWPVVVREETVAYEQDRLHGYALRTPAPLRDYRGEVTFEARADGGTSVVWRGSFTELVPGTGRVVQRALLLVLRSLTRRLVRAAEREARTP
ncbi:SRPBCC family protein [Actinoallomurus rhizosphaericola]|uniref:SRPBCC family protein n=1 Tax=Actinoallomurus rhizosphaericola TaxID=2952536 RepID=UPI0020922F7F|nr:SRPBCC family protein [Actinoallomurus rhizosphaericola]MCO5997612.1 SRPBCC family protein [Actinoallomurus rhizosphaericola]